MAPAQLASSRTAWPPIAPSQRTLSETSLSEMPPLRTTQRQAVIRAGVRPSAVPSADALVTA